MITGDDFVFLRRAIDIAATAITAGDDPYGSLLAGPGGEILIEAHNTVRRDHDITAHPELKLARWAARELGPDTAARTTMYTSCQPCEMCAGAIARSGLGRVVYALSTEQGGQLNPALHGRTWPATGLHCSTRHVSPSTATTSRNPRPGPAAKMIDRCLQVPGQRTTERSLPGLRMRPNAQPGHPMRLLMSFQTAWAGAGSGEVPGWALFLRLPACSAGCGSFMACALARCRGEAWLKKGLPSSK